MKKLRLDDLHVDSFVTTTQPSTRGTVVAHNTADGNSCNTYCQTEAYRASCSPAQCTGTGGGQSVYCNATDKNSGCCHPYGESMDWTFCMTECCNDSNVQTCQNWGCTS